MAAENNGFVWNAYRRSNTSYAGGAICVTNIVRIMNLRYAHAMKRHLTFVMVVVSGLSVHWQNTYIQPDMQKMSTGNYWQQRVQVTSSVKRKWNVLTGSFRLWFSSTNHHTIFVQRTGMILWSVKEPCTVSLETASLMHGILICREKWDFVLDLLRCMFTR